MSWSNIKVECTNCGKLEDKEIYCVDCHKELQDKIKELENEIGDLKTELGDMGSGGYPVVCLDHFADNPDGKPVKIKRTK